jgi:hypothetical protein
VIGVADLESAVARVLRSQQIQKLLAAAEAARRQLDAARELAKILHITAAGDFTMILEVAGKCDAAHPCPPELLAFRTALSEALSGLDLRLDSLARWGNTLASLQSIVRALVTGRTIQRGDVVALVAALREAVDHVETNSDAGDSAKHILVAVLDALPNAIREDEDAPLGLRLDAPGLASAAVEGFENKNSASFYPIATVGAGYVLTTLPGTSDRGLTSTAFEELGIGYRWPLANRRLLAGPHLVTSGLLYQLESNASTKRQLFVGVGPSVNIYRLLEISANVGTMFAFDDGSATFAVTLSLQLPLVDYLEALSSGDISTVSSGK